MQSDAEVDVAHKGPTFPIAASVLLVLALLMVWPVLRDPHQVFAFNDGNIETALSSEFRYPGCMLRVWENQFFFGNGSGGVPIATWSILETLLGPHHYRREGVLFAIWLTGVVAFWTIRQFGCGRWAAMIASLLMMLCGWNLTFPMNGLTGRAFTLAWSALSLGMIERGRRTQSWLCYVGAGGLLGLAVTDTPDVGLLFAVCCGLYFLGTHFIDKAGWNRAALVRHALQFGVYVAVSVLVAYQIIVVMFATQITGVSRGQDESKREKYLWATQWSLPVGETWSLIAPDFHGASSRSAESPYWGGMGRSDGWESTKQGFRNYRLAGYAVGVVPLALLVFLIACMRGGRETSGLLDQDDRRRIWILGLLTVISLMLSWGKHFFLYSWFYALPYMGTIRNPDKWLGPFSLCLTLVVALAVDLLIRAREYSGEMLRRRLFKATAIPLYALGGLTLLVALGMMSGKQKFIERLVGMGFQDASLLAWQHAVGADFQTLIVTGLIVAVLYCFLHAEQFKSQQARVAMLAALGFLTASPLLWAGRPFIAGYNYSHILAPNPLTSFLDQHKTDGRIKLIPAQHPLLNHWRMSMLFAKGYDLFDPVSVSRMPNDYQALFTALASNPLRLWQIGAIRYFLCTADVVPELAKLGGGPSVFEERLALGAAQLNSAYIPTASAPPEQRMVRLLEFTGTLPMYRFVPSSKVFPATPEGDTAILQRLAEADFDAAQEVLLQGGADAQAASSAMGTVQVSQHEPAHAEMMINLPAPGLLVRAVKYHPDWKVTIDGQPGEVLKADFLFQAVHVPGGEHKIIFNFHPSLKPMCISIAGRAALLLCFAALPLADRLRRKKP